MSRNIIERAKCDTERAAICCKPAYQPDGEQYCSGLAELMKLIAKAIIDGRYQTK